MKWNDIQNFSRTKFKRSTGVSYEIFLIMLDALEQANAKQRKHPSIGVRSKLSSADKILLLLMYYREYRTMFHIGVTYEISESSVCKIIMDTESKLINDTRFHLPGKKALLKPENDFNIVLIDVAETPIERPKKNSEIITAAKRNDIPSNHKSLPIKKQKK